MMPEEEDSVATVVLTIEVEGLGSVSLSPLGAMVDGGFEYSRSAVVTLNAIPADGWVFTGWLNENLPETPEVSVALENSLTVGVRFDPFIAGDVFSFLTPDETGLFLALTGAAQHEITVALVETQDAIDQDYASRGSIGSSQWCGDRCDALQIAVDLWRLSTWENLAIVLGDNYLFLTQQQIEEVNEWNLAKYPDAPEAELSGFTCNC